MNANKHEKKVARADKSAQKPTKLWSARIKVSHESDDIAVSLNMVLMLFILTFLCSRRRLPKPKRDLRSCESHLPP